MAEVNFSGKLAKTIKIGDVKLDNDAQAKEDVLKAIFGEDAVRDKKITIDELTKTVGKIDTNKDGKIDDAEIKAAVDAYNATVASDKQIQQNDYVAHLKAMAQANLDNAKDDNIGNGYTVQLGEQVNDLVERVLASQGVTKGSDGYDDKFNKCKQAIIDNNPQAFQKEGNRVKWLIAGAKIYLPTDTTSKGKKQVRDLDNKSEVEDLYRRWTSHEFGNFAYRVDENGNRTGAEGVTYTKVGGGRSSGGATGGDAIADKIAAIDLSKAVDIEKIRSSNVGDYDVDDVRDMVQERLDVLELMKDPDNIKSVEDNNTYYTVQLKDSDGNYTGSVFIHKNDKGEITSIQIAKDNKFIEFMSDGKVKIEMNEESGISYDLEIDNVVSDFSALEKLVKSPNTVRTKMGLASYDIVDEEAITSNDLGDNDRDEVTDKINKANTVLFALETEVDEVGEPQKVNDGMKFRVKMKDGSKVDILYDNDKKVTGVYVTFADNTSGKVDVAYGREDETIAVNTDFDNSEYEVKSKGAIKDFDEIVKFVLSDSKVKEKIDGTATGGASAEAQTYLDEKANGETYGQGLYNQVEGTNWRSNDHAYAWISQLSSKNVYFAINQFNRASSSDGIIEYLDNESGFKANEIAKIMTKLLEMAKEAGIDEQSREYKAVKADEQRFKEAGDGEVDMPEVSKSVDRDILALMTQIHKKLNLGDENKPVDPSGNQVGEVDYSYYRSASVDLTNELFNEVEGTDMFDSNDAPYRLINGINENNVYFVIDGFNYLAANDSQQGIVQWLDNESGFRADKIAQIIGSLLDLAKTAEIPETDSNYKALKEAYSNFNAKGSKNYDNETYAKIVDTQIRNLMISINNKLNLSGNDPIDPTKDPTDNQKKYYKELGYDH